MEHKISFLETTLLSKQQAEQSRHSESTSYQQTVLHELRQAVGRHETEYKQLQAECDARSETITDLEARLSETLAQLSTSEANSKKREAEFLDKYQKQETRINELQQRIGNATSQTVTSEALAKAQEDL